MPTATNSSRACSSASASEVEKCRRSALRAQHLLQAGLVDRHLAGAQALDLLGVDVHAPHLAAELGEAGGGDQPDVAGADHADWLSRVAHRRGRLAGGRAAARSASRAAHGGRAGRRGALSRRAPETEDRGAWARPRCISLVGRIRARRRRRTRPPRPSSASGRRAGSAASRSSASSIAVNGSPRRPSSRRPPPAGAQVAHPLRLAARRDEVALAVEREQVDRRAARLARCCGRAPRARASRAR